MGNESFNEKPWHPDAVMLDHRSRLELEQREIEERRQQSLLEQTSPSKTPDERIRVWERRHRLALPRTSDHPLLFIIAAATQLSLDEVRATQQLRAQAAERRRAAPQVKQRP